LWSEKDDMNGIEVKKMIFEGLIKLCRVNLMTLYLFYDQDVVAMAVNLL